VEESETPSCKYDKDQSFSITHHFESHSKTVAMVMDGISQIDANGTDEDNNKYDNMLKNFLGHIF